MTTESLSNDSGLTESEDRVLGLVRDLWLAWSELPVEHPDDRREACDAVHAFQRLLATRVARRYHPDVWVTFK